MKNLNHFYDLNYETMPYEASEAIRKLDESFIGTKNYLGIAYFWSHEYRHYLRDCSFATCRKVHRDLLANDLPLDGESELHLKIIQKWCNKCALHKYHYEMDWIKEAGKALR